VRDRAGRGIPLANRASGANLTFESRLQLSSQMPNS
jgi:hypothetical protein